MHDPAGRFLFGQELQSVTLMFVLNTRKEITRSGRLGSPITTTAIQMILQRMPEEQRVTSSQAGNALCWMLYSQVEWLCQGKTNCCSMVAGRKLHRRAWNRQMGSGMDSLMSPAVNAFAL